MTFFKRFEHANRKIIEQLWQNDYLATLPRDEALEQIMPKIGMKLWLERFFLVLSVLFVGASILLFFAFNWAHIPPMLKMGGILTVIAVLAVANWYLLKRGSVFSANLILSLAAFMVGVFMAVFGQIYQTGADSYTLFLTWAIMILPWTIMARFTPLWVMWLVVCNLAMHLWWDLSLYSALMRDQHLLIILGVFHLIVYGAMLLAIHKGEQWLDKKWARILIAIGIFAPLSTYVLVDIVELNRHSFAIGFWMSLALFVAVYLFEKFIIKSLPEYSVGFFFATVIIVSAVVRFIIEYVTDSGAAEFSFFLMMGAVVGIFYFAYKYYRHVSANFEETL
ncbi:MAG: DUF2157 domain-containing protein [Hyphomicrobiales bacterium]